MADKFDYKDEFLYLTTTGRKSGSPREIEIWFVVYGDCYYICAERRERADWVQNIASNPAVSFYVNGETFQGSGRALNGEADSQLAAAVAAAFDQKYKWSDGLLVELCPEA